MHPFVPKVRIYEAAEKAGPLRMGARFLVHMIITAEIFNVASQVLPTDRDRAEQNTDEGKQM
jgi:hypothetical protein